MKNNIFANTAIIIAVIILIIAIGSSLGFSKTTKNNSNPEDENSKSSLSGNIVDINPDRMMAGAPCHVMGDQAMGDCVTREIKLEAWQYDWSEPTITVKTGELVRIIAKSRDVAHGIGIPQIGFNLVIEPGKTSVGEFIAPAPGVYEYGCSVMCGSGHHNHRGTLVVLE